MQNQEESNLPSWKIFPRQLSQQCAVTNSNFFIDFITQKDCINGLVYN